MLAMTSIIRASMLALALGWPAAVFAQAAPECRNEGIPPEFRNEKIVIFRALPIDRAARGSN